MGSKKVYEKPIAVDLNGFSASGIRGTEQGWCTGGTNVALATCLDGTQPVGDPTACNPTGSQPEIGYCDQGNIAVEGCLSGGNHF